jgi:hypothetical protein
MTAASTIMTTDLLHQHVFSSVSQLLADASAVAADAADAADGTAKELGWWGSYINLFKSSLSLVHSTIDGPLRSAGFDQTWGVSIALFTFGKCRCLNIYSVDEESSVARGFIPFF